MAFMGVLYVTHLILSSITESAIKFFKVRYCFDIYLSIRKMRCRKNEVFLSQISKLISW